jgi:hypothetical protein
MAALGEFEHPDVAIHADTVYESIHTYQFAKNGPSGLRNTGSRL